MYLIEEAVELDLDLPGGFIFDIETTGLSYRYHRLAMIGYLYQENGGWVLRQELAEKEEEEKLLLLNFLRISEKFLYTVHYNGKKFDLPFLNNRSKALGISEGFDIRRGFDLYLHVRKKKYPGRQGLNDQERRIGYKRKDRLSGQDWVSFYSYYEKTGDLKSRDLLLLHNWDDLMGTGALVKHEKDFQQSIRDRLYKDSLIVQGFPGEDEIRLLLYGDKAYYMDLEAKSLDRMLFTRDVSDSMSPEEKKERLLAFENTCFYRNIKRELERLG